MCQWCGDVEEFVNGVRDVEECANGVGDVSSGVPMVCVMWRSV